MTVTSDRAVAPARRVRAARLAPSPLEMVVALAAGTAVTVVWAVLRADGGPDDFWPRWVWFGLAVVLAGRATLGRAHTVAPGRRRWLARHAAVFAVIAPLDIAVWLLSGGGFFWPVFPLFGFSALLAAHAWAVSRLPPEREEQLRSRVTSLVRSRRAAVEDQAAQVTRIERDLHDGAQARLVSLTVSLGLAEELIRTDPDSAAGLLAESRATAGAALEDIRTVMADIRPPVLADRGLDGALRALALDLSVPVEVTGPGLPPISPALEPALYFTVAECLANVVKHSAARSARVALGVTRGDLVIEVTDDGVGGASAARGSGLRGVAARLEPFDGTLEVTSPRGGPTTVAVRVPVASDDGGAS